MSRCLLGNIFLGIFLQYDLLLIQFDHFITCIVALLTFICFGTTLNNEEKIGTLWLQLKLRLFLSS